MRPTVYIPQETMRRTSGGDMIPKNDLSPALEFGTLHILLPSGAPPLDIGPVITTMKTKLATFSDNDYIMATGDPAVIAAASIVASARNNGRIKLLRWDRNTGMYMCLQIDLTERSESNGKTNKESRGKRAA